MRSLTVVASTFAAALAGLPAAHAGTAVPARAYTCQGASTNRSPQGLQVGGIICEPADEGAILEPFTIESPRVGLYRCQKGFAGRAPVVGLFVAGRDCQRLHP
jgi:hypothetical protein